MNSAAKDAKFFGHVILAVAASSVKMNKTADKFAIKAGLISPKK